MTVTTTYDGLNRVDTKDYSNTTGVDIDFAYDTCANGKGRLCSVSSPASTTTYAYNQMGWAAASSQQTEGRRTTSATLTIRRAGWSR